MVNVIVEGTHVGTCIELGKLKHKHAENEEATEDVNQVSDLQLLFHADSLPVASFVS